MGEAQLVERQPSKLDFAGSSPVAHFSPVAQLVRARLTPERGRTRLVVRTHSGLLSDPVPSLSPAGR